MKYIILLISVFAVLSFTGCENDNNSINGPESLQKAGTGFTDPNTFDADGNLCEIGGTYNTQTIGTPMELWMGVGNETAGTLVGYVTFLTGPDRVKIDLTDVDGNPGPDFFPYVVQTAHIHFGATVDDIPHTRNGNPIPGQFEYNVPVDPYESVYEIPVEFDAVGAIHLSVVKYGGIEGFNFYLPNHMVTMSITPINDSYVKLKITGGGFISEYDGTGLGAGYYEGWCFAEDLLIYWNTNYDAYLYSSYEDIPEAVLTTANINADNLDNANYLMNKYSVGEEIFDGGGISLGLLTVDDIQHALWNLINNKTYSGSRILNIVADALQNGDGFEPSCDQKIIFLAVPSSGNAQLIIGQPIIGEIEVPCETMGGTAWGDGKFGANFPRAKQWGTYFNYDVNCGL